MNKEINCQELENNLKLNENISEQNNFLESTLGKVINFSIDTGLKAILPDNIENEVIGIKDTFMNNGFSDAINKTITDAINYGKSALGIKNIDFNNVSQAETAIEKGGIIGGVANAIETTLNKVNDMIPSNLINIIEKGKDIILNNVSSDIKKEFNVQTENVNNLSLYTKNWKESFNNHDLKTMDKDIKQIQKLLKNTLPIENLIKQAREIENIHLMIKNNNGDFNISDEKLKLANLLA